MNDEVLATLEGIAPPESEAALLVFQRVGGHLMMRASTVKAHIKDCARVLSTQYVGKIDGERMFSTRVINGVYLDPREYWLPLRRPDGSFIDAEDGRQDKAVHVWTPRGSRSALKSLEFIAPPVELSFKLRILGHSAAGPNKKLGTSITQTDLDYLFEYGGTHGYAGERGDGEGRYEYSFQRIDARDRDDVGVGTAR